MARGNNGLVMLVLIAGFGFLWWQMKKGADTSSTDTGTTPGEEVGAVLNEFLSDVQGLVSGLGDLSFAQIPASSGQSTPATRAAAAQRYAAGAPYQLENRQYATPEQQAALGNGYYYPGIQWNP